MEHSIEELRQALKAMIRLDIIMTEEEESWLRLTDSYYEEESQTLTVQIKNGAGDEMAVLISPNGAVIKGFDHEDILSPYGDAKDKYIRDIYQGYPPDLPEPLEKEEVTFCMWRQKEDISWKENPVSISDGGKEYLLGYIAYTPKDWISWAKEYFELEEIPFFAVEKIYQSGKADPDVITALNPARDVQAALKEIRELKF